MQVAVEATRLLGETRGIGRYVRALLPRLAVLRPELRLVLFAKNDDDVAALSALVAGDPRLRRRVDVHPVRYLSRWPADILWYPWNIANPVPNTSHGAVVVTIHDVAPVVLPDPRWLAWRTNHMVRRRYLATARRATMIVADSMFTASEVERVLGYPRDRIRVALLGADDFPGQSTEGDAAVLTRLQVATPFVLTVGADDKRKNHELAERAVGLLAAAGMGVTLVEAGPRAKKRVSPAAGPWVRRLGFVSDSDLAALYRAASVLVMPSRYEGFGLPVLEAMRLGLPVICARTSSLPEVAGNAALWVDADDDAQLASAITLLISDERLRGKMRAIGMAQAARFSWEETARVTLETFDMARELHSAQAPDLPSATRGRPRADSGRISERAQERNNRRAVRRAQAE